MNQDDELYNSIMGIQPSPEEEEQSLIRKLAAQGMTGLQYVGETLDKPGQALRGVLAGKWAEAANLIPFSDALGITSSEGLLGGTPLQVSDDEDAVSGRDLLEKAGWLGANEEGLDWGDVAGFGADILTDPTTWIPGVGWTKVGKAFKAAGLASDPATLARRAGLDVAGAATARHQLTGKHLLEEAAKAGDTTAMDRLRLAYGKGKELADIPEEELAKPIGGMFNVGVPFVDSAQMTVPWEWGAEKLDKAIGGLRYGTKVGRGLNAIFDAGHSTGNLDDARYTQEVLLPNQKLRDQQILNRLNPMISEGKARVAVGADELLKPSSLPGAQGPVDPDIVNAVYRSVEGVGPDPLGLHPLNRNLDETARQILQDANIPVSELHDPLVDHAVRRKIAEDMAAKGGGTEEAAKLTEPRYDELKGVETSRLRNLFKMAAEAKRNANISSMVDGQNKVDALAAWLKQVDPSLPTYTTTEARQALEKLVGDNYKVTDPETIRIFKKTLDPDVFQNYRANRMTPAEYETLKETVAAGTDLDRYDSLAKLALGLPDEVLQSGLYMDLPGAQQLMAKSTANQASRAMAFKDAIADPKLLSAYSGPMISVEEAAKRLGMDASQIQSQFVNVPEQLVKDLMVQPRTTKDTGALGKLADIVRNITGVNKAWMTGAITNPSFPSRNVGSGQVANSYFGLANPLEAMHGIADFFTGGKLAKTAGTYLSRGEDIPGIASNIGFQNQAKIAGRVFDPSDDKGATNWIRELISAHSGSYGGKHTADTLLDNQTGVGDFLGGMLGPEGPEAYSNRKVLGEAAKTWDQLRGREGGWKELLVGAPGVGGRKEATSAPLKAGATLNNYAESLNRVNPWLSQFLKGTDPTEAMRQVNRAQINYSPKNFTDIENRYLTQLIPFYKFLKSSGAAHLDELVHNPGGPLSQLLQGTSQIHDTEEVLPEYVKENLAIPVDKIPGLKQLLGSNDPESKRYLTGLGMMYEPLTQLIAGGDRGDLPFLNRSTAFESLGTLNPLIKALGETATGRSFFRQDETGGGQLMDELDPVIGRLLSNIKDRATGTKTEDPRMPVPGAGLLEVAAANSPLSRLFSTARGLTDTREGGWKKGLSNFLIGPKLTDVNDKAVLGVLRGLANQDINTIPAARQMVDFYVPKSKQASLTPDEIERLNQDMLIKKIVQKKLKRKDSVVDPLEQLQATLLGL